MRGWRCAQCQLLDGEHLLLSMLPGEAITLRLSVTEAAQQAVLLVVYSIAAARVVAVFSNSRCICLPFWLQTPHGCNMLTSRLTSFWLVQRGAAAAVLPLWQQLPCRLRHLEVAPLPAAAQRQHLCPAEHRAAAGASVLDPPAGKHTTLPALPAHLVSKLLCAVLITACSCGLQMTKRVLYAIPATAQSMCASPFLDATLFQFDEKNISAVVRARPFTDQSIKFAARSSPEKVRFNMRHADFQAPQATLRSLRQTVTHHCHPVYPFVLGVLQTFVQPTQLLIYMRI